MKDFDPNSLAQKNGQFLGLSYSEKEADICIVSVPWDVTTSYGEGTAKGPAAVIEASYQLDLMSPYLKNSWETKIFTQPISKKWLAENARNRKKARQYLKFLEQGGDVAKNKTMKKVLQEINYSCHELQEWSEKEVRKILAQQKHFVLLGGDHSVSFGAIKALSEKEKFSILHIDAHSDLRKAYEGFYHSHASIMYNVLPLQGVEKIVQVGIRDFCPEEKAIIDAHTKMKTFFDADLKRKKFQGVSWQTQCKEIVKELGEKVYISFDIDGLNPSFCPHTGTPVPGGLEFDEVFFLFNEIINSGRKIIAADLVEVAPGDTEWDANVGARALFHLCCFIKKSVAG